MSIECVTSSENQLFIRLDMHKQKAQIDSCSTYSNSSGTSITSNAMQVLIKSTSMHGNGAMKNTVVQWVES